MRIACQDILISEYRRGHRVALGIIDLRDTFGHVAQELGIMEFMTPIFLAIELETTITQRELTIRLPCRNGIRQHTTHRIRPLVSDYRLTEIHHTATLGLHPTATLGIIPDSLPRGLSLDQSLKMLFRIAPRQQQEIDAAEIGNLRLRVEKPDIGITVDGFLIEEREALGIAGDQD